jgi:hypothetical protein
MTRPVFFCLMLALCVGPVAATHAAEPPQTLLYRYVDSRGITVLDRQGVPPEYIAKGYEVLNAQGRVVQTVPPAPSAEQIRQAQAKKAQASADAQLLDLYSNVDDVDRALARKLSELDALIAMTQGNLKGLMTQLATLQGQAADHERAGRPIAQSLIDQMGDLREQQQNLNQTILRYQQARSQAEVSFAEDRVRILQLTSQ